MKAELKWYALKVVTGQEQKAKAALELALAETGLEHDVERILVPSEKMYEVSGGRKKLKDKTFFPGYLLVYAKLDNRMLHVVSQLPVTLGFLGSRGWGLGNEPVALRQAEISRILGRVEGTSEFVGKVETTYAEGEEVRVVGGPFADAKFRGTVKDVFEERKKLNVMVKIFGRNTLMELDYTQVEKIA